MVQPHAAVKVWDPLQRVLHWGLVGAVVIAWWAGEGRLSLHLACGYVALAIVGVRFAWGLAGSRYARFADFVHGPGTVLRYSLDIVRSRERRYLGHNPLGGWMVVLLLLCVAVICASGWLYTTDAFWGVEWVEVTHRVSAWTLVGLVALHVAGVIFTSWRHRENLVGAMVSGRKSVDEEAGDLH